MVGCLQGFSKSNFWKYEEHAESTTWSISIGNSKRHTRTHTESCVSNAKWKMNTAWHSLVVAGSSIKRQHSQRHRRHRQINIFENACQWWWFYIFFPQWKIKRTRKREVEGEGEREKKLKKYCTSFIKKSSHRWSILWLHTLCAFREPCSHESVTSTNDRSSRNCWNTEVMVFW